MSTSNKKTKKIDTQPTELYFERQRKKLCGLHSLNNFFQCEKFTQKDMNDMAYEIDITNRFINPHKSVLGLGDYDANVLVKALTSNGYEIQWFDKREKIDDLNLDELHGILINTISFRILSLYEARHWFILKNMNQIKIKSDNENNNNNDITPSEGTTITENQNSIPLKNLQQKPFSYVLFNSSNSSPLPIETKEKVLSYLGYILNNSNAELILIK
ncbi:hypothetical protein RB653_007038 [Dictyostelium firmibasis]|uniref:ubiquitinyl hydrolase 1 n=1 Tax=Dictyostelium firmibasis TaxID=79012 RepID=A0AAN7TV12_9MYCE